MPTMSFHNTMGAKRGINDNEILRRDNELLHVVDNWLEKANRAGGDQIACHKGCTQCCYGAFAINRLDAQRLQRGLNELADHDLERAQRVVQRSADWLERNVDFFPGDMETGVLHETPEAEEIFEEYANDEPCPALDPETKTCDLYAHRPMTCRVFGPVVRNEDGLGTCELCFTTATPEQIAAAEVPLEGGEKEDALNACLERSGGKGRTIVAFALLGA